MCLFGTTTKVATPNKRAPLHTVLILVILDVPLRRGNQLPDGIPRKRLNPCYSGCASSAKDDLANSHGYKVLILVILDVPLRL